MRKTLIQAIASTMQALQNCRDHGNAEWAARHAITLSDLEGKLPRGSGFDAGSKVNRDKSALSLNRIVLSTSFHHMNESGMYDGWTEHDIVVEPSFDGITVAVRGRDRNGVKEYIAETFRHALMFDEGGNEP